jgi:diguanylate cyclase (GGDEF)-like protein
MDQELECIMNHFLCRISKTAIFRISRSGDFEWYNEGAKKIFGEDSFRKVSSIYEILGEESRITLGKILGADKDGQVAVSGAPRETVLHFLSPGGSFATFSTFVFFLSDRKVLMFCEYRMLTDNEAMKKMARLYSNLSEESRKMSRERKQLQVTTEEMSNLASRDPLTGLANRRTLERFLAELEGNLSCVVIMTDLDDFKEVNDTYGHQFGDEVLREFARVISENGRKDDLAARYGGEEFVVILNDVDPGTGEKIAERMRQDVLNIAFDAYPDLRISASFGLADLKGSENWEKTLEKADKALYRAKRTGKNRVVPSEE